MKLIANPHLAALQQKALAERRRRGEAGYVDDHVKRLAIHLVIEEIELSDCSPTQSIAIAEELGLSLAEYICAVSWLDPDHAERLEEVSCRNH